MKYNNAVAKKTFVIIKKIYNGGDLNKSALAAFRESPSVISHHAQQIWPILLKELSKDMLSTNGEPSAAERAIFTAIKLYAIYQKGEDRFVCSDYSESKEKAESKEEKKQRYGIPLFYAFANLKADEQIEEALDRRVQSLLSSPVITSVVNSMTQLVRILKSKDSTQVIDFPRIAQDLYDFQQSYYRANEVHLYWAEQYFSKNNVVKETEEKNND
ncbi:type I-E CRISPR-associated protein Cse2/CasB [Lactobacillus sp. ESL0681]|uniref:type I-E CRISPR-associated protein Cse2/CasB n=1 Tax=Lactobacillus sp. ESL0681 TaxID=2983211 RepID=UPI0023F91A22|nr:type I-E CRISPR-associated protein Cse2/CasB [Lactobacillus sp. ESL0681]WEV39898.1 type I-E CRISPR-associated protein Cse2/CasB [Lactobacillus sp. ESL0681]